MKSALEVYSRNSLLVIQSDIAHRHHLSFIDPLESADLFEGDISGVKLTSVPEGEVPEGGEESYLNENMKNAIKNTYQRWPEGEIPYVISSRFSTYERSIIR